MGFVTNSIHFPAVQKFWKSVKIWQSYREIKGGNFFETQCTWLWTDAWTDTLWATVESALCQKL